MSGYYAHPSAIIDDGVEIGDGTKVWQWVHVMGPTRIGKNCMLGQCVFVADNVTLGDNVRVQNHTNISRNVVIEDNVYVGAGVQFCNSVHPSATASDELHRITVRSGASIGSNVCLVGPITIGERAVIGAGSVVTHDVPEDVTAFGSPAKVVKCRS